MEPVWSRCSCLTLCLVILHSWSKKEQLPNTGHITSCNMKVRRIRLPILLSSKAMTCEPWARYASELHHNSCNISFAGYSKRRCLPSLLSFDIPRTSPRHTCRYLQYLGEIWRLNVTSHLSSSKPAFVSPTRALTTCSQGHTTKRFCY